MTPQTIGRFQIVEELASYGYGSVVKATDPKTKQIVALKTFRLDVTEPAAQEFLRKFRECASAAAVLSSPNIVTICGSGEDKGLFYVAMEFVDGIRVHDMLTGNKEVSTNDLIDITRQVCMGLDHAQSHKLVHRNLRPANIMIEWDGTAKIMDFGIPVGVSACAPTNGKVPNVVHYMSPEQVRGEAMDVRSNLFSWGAMLYEMVLGKKAFAGDTLEDVHRRIASEPLIAPREIVPNLPHGIEHVLVKALAKSAAERYHSGAALLYDLEHYKEFGKAAVQVATDNKPLVNPIAAATAPKPVVRIAGEPLVVVTHPSTPKPPQTTAVANSTQTFSATTPAATPVAQAPKTTLIVTPQANSSTAPSAPIIPGPTLGPKPLTAVPVRPAQPAATGAAAAPARAIAPQQPVPPTVKVPPPVTPSATPAAKKQTPSHASRLGLPISDSKLVLFVGSAISFVLLVGIALGSLLSHRTDHQDSTSPMQVTAVPDTSSPDTNSAATASTPAPETAASVAIPDQQGSAAVQTPEPDEEQGGRSGSRSHQRHTETAPSAAPRMGELAISSNPAGAQIQIDGRSEGVVTPYVIALAPGQHTITLSKSGYSPQARVIQVSSGNHANVAVRLIEVTANALVTSVPSGSEIIVDGRDTGKVTPAQVVVERGNHTIVVRHSGYFDSTVTADLASGQSYHFGPTLKVMGNVDEVHATGGKLKFVGIARAPKNMGIMQVRTQPKGAQIVINNRMMEHMTPADFTMPPGNYDVTLSLPGYKPIRKMITVEAGSRVSLDEPLEK